MSAHGSEAPEKLKSSFILLPAFSRCFQLFFPSFWLRHCATGALVSCWNVSRKCQSKLSDCSICQEKRVKLKLFSLVSTQVPKLWSEYLPDSLTYNRNVIAAVRLFPPALFSDPVRFSTLVFFLFFFFLCPLSLSCSELFPPTGFQAANIYLVNSWSLFGSICWGWILSEFSLIARMELKRRFSEQRHTTWGAAEENWIFYLLHT